MCARHKSIREVPEESSRTSVSAEYGNISRLWSGLRGLAIGLAVGAVWALAFGPSCDGPPSMALSFVTYTVGLGITGFAVGALRRFPSLVGALVGLLLLSAWAIFVAAGRCSYAIMFWIVGFGGSGLLWGGVTGVISWWVEKKLAAARKRA